MAALISIITPLFNRTRTIHETWLSVLNQTYQNWEWIVVDDGSTDNSFDIVLSLASNESRIKAIQRDRQPKGADICRNIGIENASGEYLIFLDSDDLLVEECLSKRYLFSVQHPGYDFYCFPTALFIKNPGDQHYLWNYLNVPENDLIRFLKQDMPWHTSGVLWTKRFLKKVNGWDPDLICWQDWDIHIRALLMRGKYLKATDDISNIDSYYRMDADEGRISASELNRNNLRAKMYLVKKHIDHIIEERDQSVNLEYARLIYRIAYFYSRQVDKKEAVFFLTDNLKKLGFNHSYVMAWGRYLTYRFDTKFPRIFRKLFDLVPNGIYRDSSLVKRKTSHLKAVYK